MSILEQRKQDEKRKVAEPGTELTPLKFVIGLAPEECILVCDAGERRAKCPEPWARCH